MYHSSTVHNYQKLISSNYTAYQQLKSTTRIAVEIEKLPSYLGERCIVNSITTVKTRVEYERYLRDNKAWKGWQERRCPLKRQRVLYDEDGTVVKVSRMSDVELREINSKPVDFNYALPSTPTNTPQSIEGLPSPPFSPVPQQLIEQIQNCNQVQVHNSFLRSEDRAKQYIDHLHSKWAFGAGKLNKNSSAVRKLNFEGDLSDLDILHGTEQQEEIKLESNAENSGTQSGSLSVGGSNVSKSNDNNVECDILVDSDSNEQFASTSLRQDSEELHECNGGEFSGEASGADRSGRRCNRERFKVWRGRQTEYESDNAVNICNLSGDSDESSNDTPSETNSKIFKVIRGTEGWYNKDDQRDIRTGGREVAIVRPIPRKMQKESEEIETRVDNSDGEVDFSKRWVFLAVDQRVMDNHEDRLYKDIYEKNGMPRLRKLKFENYERVSGWCYGWKKSRHLFSGRFVKHQPSYIKSLYGELCCGTLLEELDREPSLIDVSQLLGRQLDLARGKCLSIWSKVKFFIFLELFRIVT